MRACSRSRSALRATAGWSEELAASRELQSDSDAGMRALGDEEVERLQQALSPRRTELRKLLLPKDPRDDKNIFLEVRAGTGGDEAAIFAGDLHRMYARYAESKGFSRRGASARAPASTAATRRSSAASSARAPSRC